MANTRRTAGRASSLAPAVPLSAPNLTHQGRPASVAEHQPAPRLDLGALAFGVMLALVIVGPLQRGLYFAPEFDAFAVVVGILLAIVALDHAVRGRLPFATRPIDWAAMAVALGYLIAYLRNPVVPYAALQGALRAGIILAWYWLCAATLGSPRRLSWWMNALAISGGILALVGCLAAAGKINLPSAVLADHILSTIQYTNAFGAVLVFTMIITATLVIERWAVRDRRVRRGPRPFNVVAALYGALAVLLMVTLIGTTSRGAWILFPLAAAFWLVGLPPLRRWAGAVALLWPAAIALLLSRAILDGFWGGHGSRSLAVLAVGMAVGAAGFGIERWVSSTWRRQVFSPAVRWALEAAAGVYVLAVIGFLLLSTSGSTSAVAGRGILSPQIAERAGSISLNAPALQGRIVMWGDALKLVRQHPLLGLGGGGWAAVYHTVQSALYWSTQVHEAILQAWVDGGLLAGLGVAAVGACLLVAAWRRRGSASILLWGMIVASAGIWVHGLVDFDLSIPAVALLLWGGAGALRAAEPAPAPGKRMASITRGLVSGAALAVVAVVVMVSASRLEQARTLASEAANALTAKQFTTAYAEDASSLTLEPLAPTVLADKAQLLAAAYATSHNQGFRQQAADVALAAMQFGPGDYPVATTAMGVLATTGHWPGVASGAESLLTTFPLDPTVAGVAGQALVRAAIGDIGTGEFTSARTALERAASLRATLAEQYAARTDPLGAASFSPPVLGEDALLAQGQADALLGRWQSAIDDLAPLLESHTAAVATAARVWTAVAEQRAGLGEAATATLSPLRNNAQSQAEERAVLRLTGFVREVNHG